MRNISKQRSLTTLAALLSFALFALGLLWVLLGGAGVYRRLTRRDQESFEHRTCSQYIATKLRQAPSPEGVAAAAFGQADALVITEAVDGISYSTRIYCHDGWLMELFAPESGDFSPEDGEKILPLRELSVAQTGALMEFTFTSAEGECWELALAVRGKEVG